MCFQRLNFDVDVFFDIGSRDGRDSKFVKNNLGVKQCHMFECNPEMLDVCRENTSEDVYLHEFAVWHEDTTLEFHRCQGHIDHVGSSSLFKINPEFDDKDYTDPKRWMEPVKVLAKRVDNLIDQGLLPVPDFMQIDVQGAELSVLQSFGDHLDKVKGMVVETSLKPQYLDAPLHDETIDFLESKGFGVYGVQRGNWFNDVVLFRKDLIEQDSRCLGPC
jgi:FkbM family methyltransferase